MVGGFFGDYRVSPNFLVVLQLRLGLGCDYTLRTIVNTNAHEKPLYSANIFRLMNWLLKKLLFKRFLLAW